MRTKLFLATPANFSFRHTVYSHGWSELLPFRLDDENWRLEYVFAGPARKPVAATIYETDDGLEIEVPSKKFD